MYQFIVKINGRTENFWAESESELRSDLNEFYPDADIEF